MEKQEFENFIKKTLNNTDIPSRASLLYVLRKLDTSVTENKEMRYNSKAATPNIIINKITDIIGVWKSKRLILIPSLVLIIFVSIFSLSPRNFLYRKSLQNIAEQDRLIEELVYDTDTDLVITSFEDTDTNDLGILNNEI